MDILATARRLEAVLSKQLDRAAERVRTAGPPEPLEVAHAIVESVARHVQPGGRGRYVFPYHRVKITIAAPNKDARAQLDAVIDGEPSLSDRIIERLTSAGCDGATVDVRVVYVAAANGDWTDPAFNLEFLRVNAPAAAKPAAPDEAAPSLKLTIEHGKAEKASYTFAATPIYLGRCSRHSRQPSSAHSQQSRGICRGRRRDQRQRVTAACARRVRRRLRASSRLRRSQRTRHAHPPRRPPHRRARRGARDPDSVRRRHRPGRGARAREHSGRLAPARRTVHCTRGAARGISTVVRAVRPREIG